MSLSGKTAAKTSLKKHILSDVKGSKLESIFIKFKVMVYLVRELPPDCEYFSGFITTPPCHPSPPPPFADKLPAP